MKKFLYNERGFMLLNVVFLTLITSFAAMILFNAAPRIKNPHSVLRLTAIHLANEKFALIESNAVENGILDLNCSVNQEHLTTKNLGKGKSTTFTVTANKKNSNGNTHEVTVKVEWSINEQQDYIEIERTIRVVPKENP